ncbi:MAG: hypothetical protein FJY75_01090 [Candidatus Eisenbacteria bacterium]|uniref:T9SS type A sorting domain-containing protein n=1 Tax=Eiseniibacteriota bacterium TaxID=2212470 RepID=A0A938BKW0_UNCEI|nr:hypothetical protein [Candidatus Eisenbacteria bacterium]
MKRLAFTPSRGLLGFALAMLLVLAQHAAAFQPAEQNDWYEKPLRQFDLVNFRSPEVETARSLSAEAAAARFGGDWVVQSWNPQTRTPGFLYGSGADLSAAAAREGLEETARQVVAAHPEIFRAEVADLRLASTASGRGKRTVHFQQTHEGLDVWGGRVWLTFTEAGRLFAMGSEYYGDIGVDARPALSSHEAEAIARRDLPYDPLTDEVEEGTTLLVLPEPLTESTVAHRLVWRVRVRTENPIGIWVTHVDAHNGEIVWRYNDVHFLDLTGSVATHVQPDTWCNDQVELPSPYMRVNPAGLPIVYTDSQGNFTVPNAGGNPVSVTVDFYGPYARVINQGGPSTTLTQSVTPGTPASFIFNDRNAQNDERDVFEAVQEIHDFFQTFAPSFSLPNQRMTCNVSLNNTCNAFWNGTINFFRAGDGCANTGEIQGVVHHEYGHGVQAAILGWQGDQGLGEGNSDILANLLTQEAIIGRGFYVSSCRLGLRTSLNLLRYPEHVIDQPIHSAGRVIAGFHWDLMVLLQDIYGQEEGTLMAAELWHYGRVLQHPTTQPAQVLATFIADDDDGNLYNGTPHFELICEAATNHGFSCPTISQGVFITHTPPWSFTEPQDVQILATITSTAGPLDANALRLLYTVDGGAQQELPLAPTGNPDEYGATIAGLELPSAVEYYIRAEDLQGNARNEPALAPAVRHSFDYGLVYDPFEVESGWTVDPEGTDTATSGHWVRAEPVGTVAQPGSDHTPAPGTMCWVTGNAAPEEPAGANDVDGGVTSLYSPIYNLTGAPVAAVRYWRWYSNNRGYDPHEQIWVVQVRNNGGGWVDVERTESDQNRWVAREADLLALFGGDLGQVQFRFLASDEGASLVEAAVDDFVIRAIVDASAVPAAGEAAPRFAFFGSRANPLTGPTEIAFQVPARVAVRLSLFDVGGRLVRTIADREFDAGVHTLAWDGRNGTGQAAASGIYYCRLQAPGFDATQKLVLQR